MPSSVIAHFRYDEDEHILQVTFVSGLLYNYAGVPGKVFEGLKKARSKGIYFNRYIKDKYPFERLN